MTSFKTRVIGAVILVSLAVIFVPMLFKSPESQTGHVEVPQRDTSPGNGGDRSPMVSADSKAAQRLEVPPIPEVPDFTIEEPVEPDMRYTDRTAEQTAPRSTVEARGGEDFQIEQPDRGSVHSVEVDEPVTRSPAADARQTPTSKPEAPAARSIVTAPIVEQGAKPAGDFGEAWAIQVGSFADQIRAQKIRADLQKEGTAAYVQEVQTNNGATLIRVYAGPMLERSTAEKLKVTVDKKLGVNSLIMRYRPVQP